MGRERSDAARLFCMGVGALVELAYIRRMEKANTTGARIRRMREEKKLSRAQLAELLDTSGKTIYHHETGRNAVKRVWLIAYAAIFGCKVEELECVA